MGWVSSGVAAEASNSVEAHQQGLAAGAISASQGLGVMIGALIYPLGWSVPHLVAAVILCLVCVIAGHSAFHHAPALRAED